MFLIVHIAVKCASKHSSITKTYVNAVSFFFFFFFVKARNVKHHGQIFVLITRKQKRHKRKVELKLTSRVFVYLFSL